MRIFPVPWRSSCTESPPSLSLALATLALGALASACSAGTDANDGPGSSGTISGGSGGNGQGGNIFAGVGGGGIQPEIGGLSGSVTAPNGTVPIDGALVYLTQTPPDAIPDGVYCDKCIEIDPSLPHAFSAPDGSFRVPTTGEGMHYLVVQKGQFRRVRQIDIIAGELQAQAESTRLPSRMDKANGDDIPKMAVLSGNSDNIVSSLVQLGVEENEIDVFECDFLSCDQTLFDSYATLSQYHIAFVPCSSGCGRNDDSQGAAIQQFVAAGGKYYVTDWSYQWMQRPFPSYVTFQESGGDACGSEYDASAAEMDPGLSAWLGAQNVTNPTFEDSWTIINSVNPVQTTDVNDQPATITPKVWITGNTPSGPRPLTVSFERGCGRVLFSTYHTETGGSTGLKAQELALLYVLLEVGVCVEPVVPQ
jgi:hypothetical protein